MEQEKEKNALQYFSRDEKSYVDMAECVRRGAAVILYAKNDGVLLYEKASGIYMFAAEEKRAAEDILARFEKETEKNESGLFVAHGETARAAAYKRLRIDGETVCFQVVCLSRQPRAASGRLRFDRPGRDEIEVIKRDYHLESPENIEKLCADGKIWCGFLREKEADAGECFVGFIGCHPEGSMGLLQVFPPYRRCGYGEELENFMINVFLSEGRIPYAHIIDDNLPSMSLQKKLGYEIADKKVYWLFQDR